MLMLFRYIILLQIHLNKKKLIKNLRKNQNFDDTIGPVKKCFSFILKYLSSPWIIPLGPLVWVVLFDLVLIVIYALNGFLCSVDTYFYMRNAHAVFIFLVFASTFIVLIFDFLCNLKLLFFCKCKKIFIEDDPYHYRLDMISFLFMIPFAIVWFFVSLPQYFISVIIDITVLIGMFTTGLNALIITIIYKIVTWIKNQRNYNSFRDTKKVFIEDILKDDLIDLFAGFCEEEWSTENIFIKLDFIKYKNASGAARITLAETIKRRYLLSSSPLEVNSPGFIVSAVLKSMEEKDYSDDLFKDLEISIDANLNDTLSRFRFSVVYSVYLEELKDQSKTLGL
jgi:hypothetical protein